MPHVAFRSTCVAQLRSRPHVLSSLCVHMSVCVCALVHCYVYLPISRSCTAQLPASLGICLGIHAGAYCGCSPNRLTAPTNAYATPLVKDATAAVAQFVLSMM